MINNRFDWIFFDVGGPLATDEAAVRQRIDINLRVLQQFRPDLVRQDIIDAWPEACARLGSVDKNLAEVILHDKEAAKRAWDEVRKQKALAPHYFDTVTIRPEAADICAQLAQRYKLGIIANQPAAMKEKLLAAGVLQHFSHQKMSEEYGLEKPDPALYRRILEETGADPMRSVMIDDNIERSLLPAKALGMSTVWYKLQERKQVPEGSCDFTITSLNDLLSLFL